MAYLAQILLAVLATAAAETTFEPARARPLLLLVLLPLPHALGYLARALSVRGRFRSAEALAFVVHYLPPLLQGVAISVFGWRETLAGLGLSVSVLEWPHLALLLLFLPYVLLQLAAIDARARLHDPTPAGRCAHRALQTRLFAAGLAPVALFIVVSGLVALDERLRVRVEEVDLFATAFSAALLLLLALSLPTLLRSTWETAPLERGPVRDVLEGLARRAGFRCREILLWRTGHLMANAAIVGITPRSRVVLLSDSLLARLGPRELEAVFAHEMGHAVHHHVRTFLLWTLGFFLMGDALFTLLDLVEIEEVLLALLPLAALWYFGFGYLSRRSELQADLHSLRLVGSPVPLVEALQRVGGSLHDKASWRHFGTGRRVRELVRAASDPEVGARLDRRLGRWALVGTVFFVAALALEGYALTRRLTHDQLLADLRLGEYAQAAERLRSAPEDLDPLLRELVREAAIVPAAQAEDPAGLEAYAAERLAAGDGRGAWYALELAVLRGERRLRGAADVLERALRDPRRPLLEGAQLDDVWRARLEPILSVDDER